MKKILAMMLTAAMMLSMGTAAMADDDTTVQTPVAGADGIIGTEDDTVVESDKDLTDYLDQEIVVPKKYVVNSGTAPAETFEFKFEAVSHKDVDGVTKTVEEGAVIPAIDNVEIAYVENITATTEKTVEKAIDVANYALGVYTYKVTEVAPEGTTADPKTAGITYSDEELYLVLTILRDEKSGKHYVAAMHYSNVNNTDKESGFTNEYDTGSLVVGKELEGNMANMDDKFTFTVTFSAADGEIIKNIDTIVTDTATTKREYTITENGYVYTFELGDGETATFTAIPEGVKYTVTEVAGDYTSDGGVWQDTDNKQIDENETEKVIFTNTKTTEVDTGISVDSIPYIAMLGVVAVGGAGVVVSKKRRSED